VIVGYLIGIKANLIGKMQFRTVPITVGLHFFAILNQKCAGL